VHSAARAAVCLAEFFGWFAAAKAATRRYLDLLPEKNLLRERGTQQLRERERLLKLDERRAQERK
jgi:hypothetical protein